MKKDILAIIVGGASVVAGIVALTAVTEADANCKEFINLSSDENYISLVEQKTSLEKTIKEIKEIKDKEKAKFEEGEAEYLRTSDYASEISMANAQAKKQIEDFKAGIQYDKNLQTLVAERAAAIEEIKVAMGYDAKVAKQKQIIADAESAFKIQEALMGSADASSKKAFQKAKEATIENANNRIAELNKELKKKSKSVTQEFENKERALKARVEERESLVYSELDKKIFVLNSALEKVDHDLMHTIEASRSDHERTLIASEDHVKRTLSDVKKEILLMMEDSLKELTLADKTALYLSSKGVSKGSVICVSTLAGIPLAYSIYKYIKFSYDILNKM